MTQSIRWNHDKPYKIMDCLEGMRELPDKCVDLVLTDPPYGIGVSSMIEIEKPDRPSTWGGVGKYAVKSWDEERIGEEYFKEIFRISKNQIVWGGNYYTDYLPPSKGWIFWDKLFDKTFNFSHGELAWTSFDTILRKFTLSSKAETKGGKLREHPTQKPIGLFDWVLRTYAKPGCVVLDPFLGSGTTIVSARRCDMVGLGFEIEPDYEPIIRKRIMEDIPRIEGYFSDVNGVSV